MATASLYFVSHVTGGVSTPNNALGNTPSTWTTDANANVSWTSRWRLDVVAGDWDIEGTQSITLRMRKGSNTGNPTVSSVQLWQGGSSVATLTLASGSTTISSTTGQDLVYNFDGSLLDGFTDVDIQVATSGVPGGGTARNACAIAMCTWAANYEAAAADPITGTLSTQETSSDTLTGSGTVAISGSVSAQEAGDDALSASGAVAVSGALVSQEAGSDSFTASGTGTDPSLFGTLSTQESGSDTPSFSGLVLVQGAGSLQEQGNESIVVTGVVLVTGNFTTQEAGNDSFSGPSAQVFNIRRINGVDYNFRNIAGQPA